MKPTTTLTCAMRWIATALSGLSVIALAIGCGTESSRSREEAPAEAGNIESGTRGVSRFDGLTAIAEYRAMWAIVIGVDRYGGAETGRAPLEFAVNDAVAIRKGSCTVIEAGPTV